MLEIDLLPVSILMIVALDIIYLDRWSSSDYMAHMLKVKCDDFKETHDLSQPWDSNPCLYRKALDYMAHMYI